MKQITLNFQEYAFIMGLSSNATKRTFSQILSVKDIKLDNVLTVEQLLNVSGPIISLDPRIDGQNKLTYYLKAKSSNYRKYLSDKECVKKLKFTAGKTIYYKILDESQLRHIELAFESNHVHMFGYKSLEKIKES